MQNKTLTSIAEATVLYQKKILKCTKKNFFFRIFEKKERIFCAHFYTLVKIKNDYFYLKIKNYDLVQQNCKCAISFNHSHNKYFLICIFTKRGQILFKFFAPHISGSNSDLDLRFFIKSGSPREKNTDSG